MADAAEERQLEGDEQEQADRHAPLSGRVLHEIIRLEGLEELDRDTSQLVWSGLAAGLSMGFSFLVQALLRSHLPEGSAWRLLDAFGYTVGFVIVVLGRQQLFTESTLSAVLPTLVQRTRRTALKTLRLWGWVLAANIAGTWIFAAMLAFGQPFEPSADAALGALAAHSVSGGFGATLLKSVLAGWLIALMVWLLPSAGPARILIIMLITYVVAMAELSHIIAGSSEAAYAVLQGTTGVLGYARDFFLPTLLGNTLGGVVLVALLNHAPIARELRARQP